VSLEVVFDLFDDTEPCGNTLLLQAVGKLIMHQSLPETNNLKIVVLHFENLPFL
jgi:hypothetical protein